MDFQSIEVYNKEMLDDKDVNRLLQVFPTKQDLEKLATKEELDERFNTAFGKLDTIIGELKTVREEQSAHTIQHEDSDKSLRKLAEEVDDIKQIPAIAHELKRKK